MKSEWNDEWLDLAANILSIGGSFDRIAKAINTKFNAKITRNSVAGKLSRAKAAGDVRFTEPKKAPLINGKKVDFLIEAWENGIGTNEIADYYGIHRNTVPKKAAEYGLKPRGTKYISDQNRENRKANNPAARNAPVFKEKNEFFNPNARKLTFLELKRSQCRFPVGEKDFIFCGADVELGAATPYCTVCKKIVYRPVA